jgi:hypothetical protein
MTKRSFGLDHFSFFKGFVNNVYLSVLDGSGFETTPQSSAILKDLHIPGKSCFQCNLKRKTLVMTSRQIKKGFNFPENTHVPFSSKTKQVKKATIKSSINNSSIHLRQILK